MPRPFLTRFFHVKYNFRSWDLTSTLSTCLLRIWVRTELSVFYWLSMVWPDPSLFHVISWCLVFSESDKVHQGWGWRLHTADGGGQYAEWHLSGGGEYHVTGQHAGLGEPWALKLCHLTCKLKILITRSIPISFRVY